MRPDYIIIDEVSGIPDWIWEQIHRREHSMSEVAQPNPGTDNPPDQGKPDENDAPDIEAPAPEPDTETEG